MKKNWIGAEDKTLHKYMAIDALIGLENRMENKEDQKKEAG